MEQRPIFLYAVCLEIKTCSAQLKKMGKKEVSVSIHNQNFDGSSVGFGFKVQQLIA